MCCSLCDWRVCFTDGVCVQLQVYLRQESKDSGHPTSPTSPTPPEDYVRAGIDSPATNTDYICSLDYNNSAFVPEVDDSGSEVPFVPEPDDSGPEVPNAFNAQPIIVCPVLMQVPKPVLYDPANIDKAPVSSGQSSGQGTDDYSKITTIQPSDESTDGSQTERKQLDSGDETDPKLLNGATSTLVKDSGFGDQAKTKPNVVNADYVVCATTDQDYNGSQADSLGLESSDGFIDSGQSTDSLNRDTTVEGGDSYPPCPSNVAPGNPGAGNYVDSRSIQTTPLAGLPTQNPGPPTQNRGPPTQNPGPPTQNPGPPTQAPAVSGSSPYVQAPSITIPKPMEQTTCIRSNPFEQTHDEVEPVALRSIPKLVSEDLTGSSDETFFDQNSNGISNTNNEKSTQNTGYVVATQLNNEMPHTGEVEKSSSNNPSSHMSGSNGYVQQCFSGIETKNNIDNQVNSDQSSNKTGNFRPVNGLQLRIQDIDPSIGSLGSRSRQSSGASDDSQDSQRSDSGLSSLEVSSPEVQDPGYRPLSFIQQQT